MISLKKIANLCNVSESTVSKALKSHPQIKAATRARIQEVAKKYNYHPNAMVECMQKGRSKTIGIAYNKFSDMFAGVIMQQIHETLYQNGYDVIIICWDLLVSEGAELLSKFSRRRVDGLLMFPMEELPSPYYLDQLRNFHNPIVIIDQTWAGNKYDLVGSDDCNGAFLATEYMIKRGISNIGNIYYSTVSSGIERRNGYQNAMSKHNLPVNDKWSVDIGDCLENSYQKIHDILSQTDKPEALVCFNDNCALDAINVAYDLNIKVPEELSIIGFGDLPIAQKMRPQLTTMRQNSELIGEKASLLLLEKIKNKGNQSTSFANHLIPTELIERASVR